MGDIKDPTKQVLSSMYREDTGSSFLDSGDAYGRAWERHRWMKGFDGVPSVVATGIDESGPTLSRNTFEVLSEHLTYEPELTRLFEAHPLLKCESNLHHAERFAEEICDDSGGALYFATGNDGDSIMDVAFQFTDFFKDGNQYILLQIHGGCDLRGGYTKPKVFRADGLDDIILSIAEAGAHCKCMSMDTENGGCTWVDGMNSKDVEKAESGWPAQWKMTEQKDGVDCTCGACMEPVRFS